MGSSVRSPRSWSAIWSWTGLWCGAVLGAQFVAFALQVRRCGCTTPPMGARSVVVLGCRLGADGAVTRLLASRLDRAVDVFRRQSAGVTRPMMVVSGGQGTATTVPEAVAMQRYLVAKGIVAGDIMVESSSRNTYENLEKTRELLDGRASEPMVVVTSDFHVWRTAAFARDLGIDVHVTGSRTAGRDIPLAYTREFAAIARRYWTVNAVLTATIGLSVGLRQHAD